MENKTLLPDPTFGYQNDVAAKAVSIFVPPVLFLRSPSYVIYASFFCELLCGTLPAVAVRGIQYILRGGLWCTSSNGSITTTNHSPPDRELHGNNGTTLSNSDSLNCGAATAAAAAAAAAASVAASVTADSSCVRGSQLSRRHLPAAGVDPYAMMAQESFARYILRQLHVTYILCIGRHASFPWLRWWRRSYHHSKSSSSNSDSGSTGSNSGINCGNKDKDKGSDNSKSSSGQGAGVGKADSGTGGTGTGTANSSSDSASDSDSDSDACCYDPDLFGTRTITLLMRFPAGSMSMSGGSARPHSSGISTITDGISSSAATFRSVKGTSTDTDSSGVDESRIEEENAGGYCIVEKDLDTSSVALLDSWSVQTFSNML
jgi:hypothetical protein